MTVKNDTEYRVFEVTEQMKDACLKPGKRTGRPPIYPWTSLEVGQGFVVFGKPYKIIQTSAIEHGKKYGKKFKLYKHENMGVMVVRES